MIVRPRHEKPRSLPRICWPAALLLAACASSAPRREAAPEIEAHSRDMQEQDAKRRDFQQVLIRLDQAMASYAVAVSERGEAHADQKSRRLEKQLRDLVLDSGVDYYGVANGQVREKQSDAGGNFMRLKALAADGSNTDRQAIALAALGFSGKREVLETIVQGALLRDEFVVDHAVMGLAVLEDPETPIGVLAAIVERPTHNEDGRAMAAWAIYQIQTAAMRDSPFATQAKALWRRYLTAERDRVPAAVVMTAVRGLGFQGDIADADLVASYLQHPVPMTRMAATIALTRMNAQQHWQQLLALLGPSETSRNVRLHARKALTTLAGNNDYGYDVAAWRKVFERGQ